MASRAKKPPGDEATPTPARPSRLRVTRPEVEEALKSPRRGRPKLKEGGGGGEDGGADGPPRYDCAFQTEAGSGRDFAPPDMVWCKVKSHPWWPAQVFDAADASELALQHAKSSASGAPLVAYFWDNTFAWSDPAALLPFRANFPSLAGKGTTFSFNSSVDAALDEVQRRVEAGLSCACFPNARKRQEVKNSGIREGAYGAVVDEAYMRDTFRGEPFLEYISALARNPLAGADRLDLATAKAQLRSFSRSRGPRELPEFVTSHGLFTEDVATEAATPQTKRKRNEKTGNEDVVPSKAKKARRGESSLRNRGAAKEEEDISVPRKSSARKKTSKDVEKTGSPAKEDAMVEDSSKQSKAKISKSSAAKKKKRDSSKDTDKGESPPEPAVEDATTTNEDSSMPSGEVTDGTFSKRRKSKKSSAKAKKKDISKATDKKESVTEPAEEEARCDDTKVSKSSAKKKKESQPEPAKEVATGDDTCTPSQGASKERKSNTSKSSAKKKKKKQDTSKDTDGVETVGGSKTPVKEAVDGALSEIKSARRLRSMHKTEDASKAPKKKKNDVGETTKGKDKDDALLKENNLGRRASSARQKDKTTTTEDAVGLADSSVKDPVSPGKKKSQQLGETSVTKESPISISEHYGIKKKKLSELLVETDTPNRSPGGKSKARGKRSLTALTEKPENPGRETKDKMKTGGKRSLPESTEEPDLDTKDTMKSRKRKKLARLGDLSSQPQPLSPKGSTKGREATPKAAGKKSQTSPVVKGNGDTLKDSSSQPQPLSPKRSTKAREATRKAAELTPHASSQTRPRRTKNSEETTVPDNKPLPHSVKPSKGKKKGATTEEDTTLSCGEMHSQLRLAASDLNKVGRITPASVGFFTEFSKSSCPSSSDVEAANADSSLHADVEIPVKAANKVASPHAEEEVPEKATEKVPEKPTENELSLSELPVADHEKEVPKKTTDNEPSPSELPVSDHEKEVPEKPADKVPSPPSEPPVADHVNEEPEKPADKEPSPSELPVADHMELPEKPAEKEPQASPEPVPVADHVKELPEKPAEKVPSPPEPVPVAEHMKDDYWADILINVEEPISRLKKTKDKSKSPASKTKELQAEDAAATPKEPSVSTVNVEGPKAAEPKQDNNAENGKAEAKPPSVSVANGGQQANAEETAAENMPLTGLVMHFSKPDAVPSHSDLIKLFSQYGPVVEARTQTGNTVNSATVIFKRHYDAEGAFHGAGTMTRILGPGLASFHLSDFPSTRGAAAAASSGNGGPAQ